MEESDDDERLRSHSLMSRTCPSAALYKKSLSLRRRRKRKAWGVSPREPLEFRWSPRQRATAHYKQRFRPLSRAQIVIRDCPGAYAPGFTLTPASQAKSWYRSTSACARL